LDTAYTTLAISPHTDGTYFAAPPGLQAFHVLHHYGEGAVNYLVDGFKVAQNIKEKYPQLYKSLVNHPFEWFHEDGTTFYQVTSPIVKQNEDGEICLVRFNNHDREPIGPNLSYNKQKTAYDLLKVFLEETNNPENQFYIKLNPGMLLIVFNWRVLHARTQYTGSRRICGCYVSVNDFFSKIRKLGYPNLKLPLI